MIERPDRISFSEEKLSEKVKGGVHDRCGKESPFENFRDGTGPQIVPERVQGKERRKQRRGRPLSIGSPDTIPFPIG